MERSELKELHYITDIRNCESIAKVGILCKSASMKTFTHSFAMESVQNARARRQLPNGLNVHQHAVVYLYARNTTLYKIIAEKLIPLEWLCVLRLKPRVVELEGAFMSDRNAAVGLASFKPVDEMLPLLDWRRITAAFWNHEDPVERTRHAQEMCAELLVPQSIPPQYVGGAFVPTPEAEGHLKKAWPGLMVTVKRDFFFPSRW